MTDTAVLDEPEISTSDPDVPTDVSRDVPGEPVPTPKPGDPDYDWSPHYDTTDLYRHTFKDGTVVVIRSMQAIQNRTWMYKMRDVKSDNQFIVLAISRASCVVADGVLMGLDDTHGDPIDELWNSWLAAGTSRGEGDEGLTAGN